jgi:hypothetical protein
MSTLPRRPRSDHPLLLPVEAIGGGTSAKPRSDKLLRAVLCANEGFT